MTLNRDFFRVSRAGRRGVKATDNQIPGSDPEIQPHQYIRTRLPKQKCGGNFTATFPNLSLHHGHDRRLEGWLEDC